MADMVVATLRNALAKLTAQKAHVDRQIGAIGTALDALGVRGRRGGTRKRRPMSAAARKAVGTRMKAYWAKRRAKGSAKK